jgi:hypothetical protein
MTCDFVKRNGRCADSCRLYDVSCLDRDDRRDDEHHANMIIASFLFAFILVLFAA